MSSLAEAPGEELVRAQGNPLGLAFITGLFAWFAAHAGPLVIEGGVRPWPVLVSLVAAVGGLRLVGQLLFAAAAVSDTVSAKLPTGKDGTAGWAGRDIRPELSRHKKGPFWGMAMDAGDTPLFIDYVSNAMTVAPAGSGKGVATVVPMGLSIRDSKVLCDLKGELVCILKRPLQARGERVRVLNPSGLFRERLGDGDASRLWIRLSTTCIARAACAMCQAIYGSLRPSSWPSQPRRKAIIPISGKAPGARSRWSASWRR